MKKDYTEETKKQIIEYIKTLEEPGFWEQIWDQITDIRLLIKYLFKDPDSTDRKEMDEYYRDIVDLEEHTVDTINDIFKKANDFDRVAAQKAKFEYEDSKSVLKELKELTAIITPGNIQVPTNMKEAISEHETSSTICIDDNGDVVYPANHISDEEIVEFCETNTGENSRDVFRMGEDTISEMGIDDILLMTLLGHTDIIISNILNTPAGRSLRDTIVDNILKGKKGYDTIEEIAKELGASEEDVRYVLEELRGDHAGEYSVDYDPYAGDIPRLRKQIIEILQRNVENALKDEDVIKMLCKEYGYDEDLVLKIMRGEIDGYTLGQFKSYLAEAICEVCDTMAPEVYPDDIKQVIDSLGNGNKLIYALEGREMSKELAEQFGKLGDIGKYSSKAIELFTYWLTDYENDVRIIDMMLEGATDPQTDPHIRLALEELKKEYTNKFSGTFDKLIELAVKEGVDFATSKFSPLSLAETAISFFGVATGADGYVDAATDIVGLQGISGVVCDNYINAIERVRNGDTSEEAITNVKLSFAMVKNVAISYYEAQVEYAKGMGHGERANTYVYYFEYQIESIKRWQLGETFKPISYETYMKL